MANKVSNFSDLIQRVTASCLLHPLAAGRHESDKLTENRSGDSESESDSESEDQVQDGNEEEEDEVMKRATFRVWKEESEGVRIEKLMEMEMLMGDVFNSVLAMKKAYVSLQDAHCPWDPEKMRVADMAVVEELKKLSVLRERFRRGIACNGNGRKVGSGNSAVREVVAPYEVAVEELKREVKSKEAEVDNLKEKLQNILVSDLSSSIRHGKKKKKGRSHSQISRKGSYTYQLQVGGAPTPDLFEATMTQVKETQKSFTSLLLSLMRSAHWDISAAVRSIEAAFSTTTSISDPSTSNHAKYALESYVSGKVFQGFDHETFYMDGSLSSLLQPDQFRRDCFTQYRDMKTMDPIELLGILPTCHFGKFCSKKYLSIVHPKMEESLFGDLEQHRQVVAGNHPRTLFYGEFLGLSKAIWLLHLLAFSLDPAPSHFEASKGAEFHPQYMESVVRFAGGHAPAGQIVGFPVSPGFKLGNGVVIKARVYLVSRT